MDVENLKQKAFGTNYVYLRILQKYKFNSNEVHYVFEGNQDQSFYFNYIQTLTDNYITHISHGKSQSIELYERLDWSKYNKKRVIIFIDRDYSRILKNFVPEDVNIYETTYYSIENYISNRIVLKRLINEILHYHEESTIEKILQGYDAEYLLFFDLLKPIIAWILLIRSHNLKANLNQIDLSKLFFLDINLKLYKLPINRIEYLERVTQIKTPKVGLAEFKHWISVINSQKSCKLVLRGKYDSWFLIIFFNKVNVFLKNKERHDSKMKTNINQANALEIIGPRTLIPARLDIFVAALKAMP